MIPENLAESPPHAKQAKFLDWIYPFMQFLAT